MGSNPIFGTSDVAGKLRPTLGRPFWRPDRRAYERRLRTLSKREGSEKP